VDDVIVGKCLSLKALFRNFTFLFAFLSSTMYNISRSVEEGKQPKSLCQSISKTSGADLTKLRNKTMKVRFLSRMSLCQSLGPCLPVCALSYH
jgi:hypothetical protein